MSVGVTTDQKQKTEVSRLLKIFNNVEYSSH